VLVHDELPVTEPGGPIVIGGRWGCIVEH
jgi:hypothetical protein